MGTRMIADLANIKYRRSKAYRRSRGKKADEEKQTSKPDTAKHTDNEVETPPIGQSNPRPKVLVSFPCPSHYDPHCCYLHQCPRAPVIWDSERSTTKRLYVYGPEEGPPIFVSCSRQNKKQTFVCSVDSTRQNSRCRGRDLGGYRAEYPARGATHTHSRLRTHSQIQTDNGYIHTCIVVKRSDFENEIFEQEKAASNKT